MVPGRVTALCPLSPPLLQHLALQGAGSSAGPKPTGGASSVWGEPGGEERTPPQRPWPVCREHLGICGELGTLRGRRVTRGQHDVRDGAWQESAPPHSSPLIRAAVGQHRFFHVHLQHLFIISTKPQDVTASDTLEGFQELQTEEDFHQQQLAGRGERVLWFGLRTEAQETGLSADAVVAPAAPRGLHGHGPITGTRFRRPWAAAALGGSGAGSAGHCPAKTTAPTCPGRARPRPHPSIGLVPASLRCLCFPLDPAPRVVPVSLPPLSSSQIKQ